MCFYRKLRLASGDFAFPLLSSAVEQVEEEFPERFTSNTHMSLTHTEFFPTLQSCPFFVKFKKLLKNKNTAACIKVLISPQITGEIHTANTAKQSIL